MSRAVAILEVMWDWNAWTSSAGYVDRAPPYFRINGDNFTGGRLYSLLGHYDLLVTNACPELVSSARGRGKPDADWLSENLAELFQIEQDCNGRDVELLLVCGVVARRTYRIEEIPARTRVVEIPHPAARDWTERGLRFVRRLIQEGTMDARINNCRKTGRSIATRLHREREQI